MSLMPIVANMHFVANMVVAGMAISVFGAHRHRFISSDGCLPTATVDVFISPCLHACGSVL
jgi:hypothetical protein